MTTPDEAPKTETEREAVKQLRRLAGAGAITLWNGGYAGAIASILTIAELDWERCWGITNRWGTGLEQILETEVHAFFPTGLTPGRAAWLEERARMPVCAGYPAAVGSAASRLHVMENGSWTTLAATVVTDELGLEGSGGGNAFDLLHLITDGREGSAETLVEFVRRIAEVRTERGRSDEGRSPSASPGCAHFSIGDRRSTDAAVVTTSAVASHTRKHTQGVTERTRAVLLRAGCDRENAPTPNASLPEVVRELQGMTGGLTELSEGTLRARFAAGRPAGLTIGEATVLLPIRSQGWARALEGKRPKTTWLEGDAAAWFTTYSTRGIQESSHLQLGKEGAVFTVGTRSTVSEELPALRVHVEISFPEELPKGPWAIEPMQLPIASITERSVITVTSVGEVGHNSERALTIEDFPCTLISSAIRITIDERAIVCALDGTGIVPAGLFTLSLGEGGHRRNRRRAEEERLLWFNPTISIHGAIPTELAGTRIAATYIITEGSHDPSLLRRLSGSDETALLWTGSDR